MSSKSINNLHNIPGCPAKEENTLTSPLQAVSLVDCDDGTEGQVGQVGGNAQQGGDQGDPLVQSMHSVPRLP